MGHSIDSDGDCGCPWCEFYPATYGTVISFTGNRGDARGKCLEAAVRKATVRAKLPATLAEGEETFELLATKPADAMKGIGFRCVKR